MKKTKKEIYEKKCKTKISEIKKKIRCKNKTHPPNHNKKTGLTKFTCFNARHLSRYCQFFHSFNRVSFQMSLFEIVHSTAPFQQRRYTRFFLRFSSDDCWICPVNSYTEWEDINLKIYFWWCTLFDDHQWGKFVSNL